MSGLRKNVIYKLSEGVIIILASIFQFYILSHYFTQAQLGNFAFVLSTVMIIKTLTLSHGVLHILVRQISQKEGSDEKNFSNAFFLRLFLSLLGGLILFPAIYYLEYFSETREALILVLGGFLAYDLFQLSEGLLVGKNRVKETAIIRSFGQIVLVLGFGLIVFLKADFFYSFIVYLASLFISGVLFLLKSKSHQITKRKLVKRKLVKDIFIQSMPITFMGLLTQLYARIDIVMIDWFLGKEQVGLYASAYKLMDYLMTLSFMMVIAFVPVVSKLIAKNKEKFKRLYKKNILAYIKIFFPLSVLIAIFSTSIIRIFYGESYLGASLSLQILMLASIFAYLNAPSGSIFIALKKQTLYLWGTLASFLVNIGMNLVLIPKMGIEGATIATVFTEIFIVTFSGVVIYREIKYLPFLTRLKNN